MALQQDRNTVRITEFLSLSDSERVTVDGLRRTVEDFSRRQENTRHGKLWVTIVTLQEQ